METVPIWHCENFGYTAEPDIPEPSLIEVELATEKLKGINLPE